MISIKNLSSGYGDRTIIRSVSLDLSEGEAHALVGLNGSGKTTLLKTIYGIVKPKAGEILYNDIKLSKKHVAFLETELYFYHGITGKEYLSLFIPQTGAFDLSGWESLFNIPLHQVIDDYSTGMKKKLALLGVIKMSKPVMLLDEPFNGLDLESSRILKHVIIKLKEKGKIILITSHMLESVVDLTEKLHHLSEGTIKQTYTNASLSEIDHGIFHELEENVKKQIDNLL